MTLDTPTGPYLPNADLVAQAWLATMFAEVDPDNYEDAAAAATIIGPTLPKDTSKWAKSGFLMAHAIPGGRSADVDQPRRLPVVQLDAYATGNTSTTASSTKPPWNLAHRLIDLARLCTEDAQTGHYGRAIDVLKPNYRQARVQAVYLLNEGGRVEDDPSGYAHVTADLAIDWVPL